MRCFLAIPIHTKLYLKKCVDFIMDKLMGRASIILYCKQFPSLQQQLSLSFRNNENLDVGGSALMPQGGISVLSLKKGRN